MLASTSMDSYWLGFLAENKVIPKILFLFVVIAISVVITPILIELEYILKCSLYCYRCCSWYEQTIRLIYIKLLSF